MKRFSTLLAACLTLGFANVGWAQQSSLFGNSGGGSRGGSSSGMGTTGGTSSLGGGASSRGGSSAGGMSAGGGASNGGFGAAGARSGAGGRGGTGQTGAGGVQQPQFNEFGSVGSQIGQNGFIGRSDSAGRFVGQTQAGQQQITSGGNFGGMNAGRGGQGGRNGNNGNNQNANQADTGRKIRPQLKLGFTVPPMATAAVTNVLATRLTAAQSALGSVDNVNVAMTDAGVVTLTGAVATQDAKSLAAAIIRLEPGVRKVVNELTIAP